MTQKWICHEEKQEREEEHVVTDKLKPTPPTDSKAIVLAGVSNEERGAAKEAIRAEKARATQEVRDA